MIKIFNANDRDFSTAGNIIIEPIKCIEYKKKSLNGWYIEVEIPIKYKEYISKDKLCVVKTKSKLNPQAFRIGEDIECSTRKIKFQANHVMFDAKDYVLLDVRPTEQNGLNALNYINERTDNLSPFSIYSNVENVNTAYFIRKNLLEAWTTIEEKWGGVFDADNWNISFLTSVGNDNGETIVYGKNMQGFDIYEDWSSVCTKLLPVGYDGLLLPETYLESDVQYEKPYTRVVDFQTNLETEEQTEEKLLEELRQNAEAYLEENKVPKVSYTIISNVNQTLEIGDTIKVLHPFVNLFTEVLEYEYDIILEKVKSLTFGNYNRDVKTKFDNIKNSITQINQALSKQEIAINTQTNLINMLNKNGYVYIDDNEILILDTLPKEKAKNVWRFGLGGIGFSSNGYEGPFEVAMTMDGQINADFITTGTMSVSRIEGLANFISETEKQIAEIEIEQGKITSKVSSVETQVNNITNTQAQAEGKNIHIEDSAEEPFVDVELYGESTQEGTPTPDNPIEIENIEGKNLVQQMNWKQVPSITTGATVTTVNGYGTDLIEVDNTKNYIFSYSGTAGSKYVAYYDESKNFLGHGTNWQIDNYENWNVTKYVRLRIDCSENAVTNLQLEAGTVATPYVPYNSLEFKVEGKNLFDKDDTNIITGKYINSEGLFNNSNSWGVTGYIKILPNKEYISWGVTSMGTNPSVNFYDKDRNYIGGKKHNAVNPFVFITPESCVYIRESFYLSDIETFMIEEGSEPTMYEPYKEQTVYFPLGEEKLMEGSYLADDGIHHSRKQVEIDVTQIRSVTSYNNIDYASIPKPSDFVGYNNYTYYEILCNKSTSQKITSWDNTENINKISSQAEKTKFYLGFEKGTILEQMKTALANTVIEYELAEEETVPYTAEQQEAWEKIKAMYTYKNITNITSDAYARIIYMRDNGLDVYETKQNAEKNYTETTKKLAEQKITVDGIVSEVSETKSNINTINNNLIELNETVSTTEQRVNEYEIKFEEKTKTINEELKENSETIKSMSYTFNTDELSIAKSDDPVNAKINNSGMRVYSYNDLKAIFNDKGTGIQKLIVVGSAQLGNLQTVKATDENGEACTDFHHLVSNIQELTDLEV